MAFEKKIWKGGERVVPQLTAEELNRLEDAIADLDERLTAIEED